MESTDRSPVNRGTSPPPPSAPKAAAAAANGMIYFFSVHQSLIGAVVAVLCADGADGEEFPVTPDYMTLAN